MADIPRLMVSVRMGGVRILDWVDQALLITYAKQDLDRLRGAGYSDGQRTRSRISWSRGLSGRQSGGLGDSEAKLSLPKRLGRRIPEALVPLRDSPVVPPELPVDRLAPSTGCCSRVMTDSVTVFSHHLHLISTLGEAKGLRAVAYSPSLEPSALVTACLSTVRD